MMTAWGYHWGSAATAALRVGIIGAGFIGDVHARAARRAGARLVGVVGLDARARPSRRPRRSAPSGPSPTATSSIASADIDVVHICTPNDLHQPLAEAALAAGKHVVCEKPLAVDVGGRRALCGRGRRRGRRRHRPVRLPLLPDGPRGPGPGRRRRSARPADPRQLPAGLAVDRAGRQLAGRRRRGRAVPGVRRHRLALVRPRRVRHRRPDRVGVRRAGHGDPERVAAGDGSTRSSTAPSSDRRACASVDTEDVALVHVPHGAAA